MPFSQNMKLIVFADGIQFSPEQKHAYCSIAISVSLTAISFSLTTICFFHNCSIWNKEEMHCKDEEEASDISRGASIWILIVAHDIVCLLHWILIEKVLCEECGQKMARSSLKRHKKYIHPVQRFFYPCEPPCKMKFRTRENLKAHKKRNSCRAGKENICPHCSQYVQGSLKEHLDKNICLMQFLCTDCGQSFRLKGALKKHKRKGCD